MTRAQTAVFLLRGIHAVSYTLPAVAHSTGFGDVPAGYWSGGWIERLAAEESLQVAEKGIIVLNIW